jgi:hypothetical protein
MKLKMQMRTFNPKVMKNIKSVKNLNDPRLHLGRIHLIHHQRKVKNRKLHLLIIKEEIVVCKTHVYHINRKYPNDRMMQAL